MKAFSAEKSATEEIGHLASCPATTVLTKRVVCDIIYLVKETQQMFFPTNQEAKRTSLFLWQSSVSKKRTPKNGLSSSLSKAKVDVTTLKFFQNPLRCDHSLDTGKKMCYHEDKRI